jgi:hypothetical protein
MGYIEPIATELALGFIDRVLALLWKQTAPCSPTRAPGVERECY